MNKINLQILYERKADKFISKANMNRDEIVGLIVKAAKKLKGNDENIDLKSLKAKLHSLYRIRKGDLRIVIRIIEAEDLLVVRIMNIDFRGNVYK